ncbi:MAG: transposase [Vicinamibacterales bacterium]
MLNRAVRRVPLFDDDGGYAAFERGLDEARRRIPVRILAYCLMPNHWHLVLWPRGSSDLSAYMHRLTTLQALRWHLVHGTRGTGPVYQGRFKSIPVQSDEHLLRACRYVERNPVRARLVDTPEAWRWSSLWQRCRKSSTFRLDEWPFPLPTEWLRYVKGAAPGTTDHDDLVRDAIARGDAYGELAWQQRALGQGGRLRPARRRGRPRRGESLIGEETDVDSETSPVRPL